MKIVYKTDIGMIRKNNDDCVYTEINEAGNALLVVLDGMGGHLSGSIASNKALEYLKEYFKKKKKFKNYIGAYRWTRSVIKKVNNKVNKLADSNEQYHDMGTTLIMGLIVQDKLIVANIGDSRLYAFDDKINQLSIDQTYVQLLYKSGKITKEDMKTHPKKNVLLNALGTYPSVTIDIKVYDMKYKYLLLCSDGLYNEVSEEQIFKIVNDKTSLEMKCEKLIAQANKNGGKDNISVVLMEA